jgi:hypothetical protein
MPGILELVIVANFSTDVSSVANVVTIATLGGLTFSEATLGILGDLIEGGDEPRSVIITSSTLLYRSMTANTIVLTEWNE